MEEHTVNARLQTASLMILATIALGGAAYWLSPVLIPFTLAIFIAFCLTPIIDFVMRVLRAPRPIAIGVSIVIGVVLLVGIGVLGTATVVKMTSNVGDYRSLVITFVDDSTERLPLESFNINPDEFRTQFMDMTSAAVTSLISASLQSVMSVLQQTLVVLVFVIFMVLGRRTSGAPPGGLLGEIEARVKRYIITMVAMSTLTGVLVGLTLTILGVRYGWLFGLLAFLLNFIPNIGSAIATLLPLPVVLLDPEMSLVVKILAIALPGAIQFTIGSIMQPRMMGKSLDLHPVTVLMALIFFGMLWGVVGMFLATPITAVIKIILERIPSTQALARLMAGNLADIEKPEAAT